MGRVVNKEENQRKIVFADSENILKTEFIQKFNAVVVCNRSETTSKVTILNFKTGQQLCAPFELDYNQVAQHLTYVNDHDLLLVGVND
jgi:hypothetical protein